MRRKSESLDRFRFAAEPWERIKRSAISVLSFHALLTAYCLLSSLFLFLTIDQAFAAADNCRETPVEVTEVKELGLSDSDETKSVIEVKWCVNSTLQPTHSAFNVTVEVTYADGAILLFDEQAEHEARLARVEVPALHVYRGKKPAVIRQIKAFVTTELVD